MARPRADREFPRIPLLSGSQSPCRAGCSALPGGALNENFLGTFRVGERWHGDSFMSSSKSTKVADDFAEGAIEKGETPGVITIDGLTGSDVMPISRYQHESEFLFQRGTEFEVVQVSRC